MTQQISPKTPYQEPFKPSDAQQEREAALKRFNRLYVLMPIILFCVISVLIIAAMIVAVLVMSVTDNVNEELISFISGLADITIITFTINLNYECVPGDLLKIYVVVHSKVEQVDEDGDLIPDTDLDVFAFEHTGSSDTWYGYFDFLAECTCPPPPKTPPVTYSPTDTPTEGPTSLPTGETDRPTGLPTSSPTAGPTSVPTEGPTEVPTSSPTSLPTGVPTSGPTAGPTSLRAMGSS